MVFVSSVLKPCCWGAAGAELNTLSGSFLRFFVVFVSPVCCKMEAGWRRRMLMASLRLARPAGSHHMVVTHPSKHPESADRSVKRPYRISAVCLRCSVFQSLSLLTPMVSISASIPTGTRCMRDAPPVQPADRGSDSVQGQYKLRLYNII